jgi:16S rRNA (cytosine967-C5)-methyltransferase
MTSTDLQPALWQQLHATAGVVHAIRSGVSCTVALEAVRAGLRPGVQALTFAVLRQLGRAQALRKLLAKHTPSAQVDALLCTALALLWHDKDAPYEAFTLVNQTVEAAKKNPATKAQASFINACLRRFLRERAALVTQSEVDPVAVWNHPAWWIKRLQTEWPTQWQSILNANDCHAPMILRVNVRRTTVAAYLRLLEVAGVSARPIGESGVALASARAVQQIPGFTEGLVSVQDAAAQLAAPLLLSGFDGNQPWRVLDACSAPGGKTAHLLESANVQVTALDIDARRCERIHQTLQRLGLFADVVTADAVDVSSWWTGELFDAMLLDAPCSASGVVRRHPDIRWLRRPTDIDQLAQIQAKLLSVLWPLLKPGGRLLYCTCSVFRAEGESQIKAFLANNTQAQLLTSPGHLLPGKSAEGDALTDNLAHEHDGFYYALLEKSVP